MGSSNLALLGGPDHWAFPLWLTNVWIDSITQVDGQTTVHVPSPSYFCFFPWRHQLTISQALPPHSGPGIMQAAWPGSRSEDTMERVT